MRRNRPHEIEDLWARWHRHVLAYALRRTDEAGAQDICAETFVVAWRRLDRVPDDPLPWLLGVARRLLANQRRAARRQAGLVARLREQPLAQASPPMFNGGHPPILTALAALSEPDREVLLLTAWEGLDNEDAATVMGCSAGALAVRRHRAKAKLASAGDSPSHLPCPSGSAPLGDRSIACVRALASRRW